MRNFILLEWFMAIVLWVFLWPLTLGMFIASKSIKNIQDDQSVGMFRFISFMFGSVVAVIGTPIWIIFCLPGLIYLQDVL